MRFTAMQEQPEIPKHEAFCEIHREMYCLGCNRHSCTARPGASGESVAPHSKLPFSNLLCGATDSPLAPGLAVQLCLLHPRQYISLCISQNTSCFGISGCSCTAVNPMYGHGYPILNRMPPLAHSSQHSPPKWALVGGCSCCKLAHTLTCTPWPVACHPPPPPPVGDHTPTVHAHLQAQKLQHKTKALSIGCVQRAANVRRPTP